MDAGQLLPSVGRALSPARRSAWTVVEYVYVIVVLTALARDRFGRCGCGQGWTADIDLDDVLATTYLAIQAPTLLLLTRRGLPEPVLDAGPGVGAYTRDGLRCPRSGQASTCRRCPP